VAVVGFKSSRWYSMIGQKQAFGSGFEPFGGAVMGPDPRHEGTAGESEPGLSVFLSVKSPAKRRPHVSTLAIKLIGSVALDRAAGRTAARADCRSLCQDEGGLPLAEPQFPHQNLTAPHQSVTAA
jgi:hypothetical protein